MRSARYTDARWQLRVPILLMDKILRLLTVSVSTAKPAESNWSPPVNFTFTKYEGS